MPKTMSFVVTNASFWVIDDFLKALSAPLYFRLTYYFRVHQGSRILRRNEFIKRS